MEISVILPIWIDSRSDRQWGRDLRNSLSTLASQDCEVIVVDMNIKPEHTKIVVDVTELFDVDRIRAPMERFNMSRGFNVGIKRAGGEYIATAGFEVMFSSSYIDVIADRASPDTILGGNIGFLGRDAEISDPVAQWDELISPLIHKTTPGRGEGYYRATVGALQVLHSDHWHSLRGYNELMPFAVADSDVVARARGMGLKRAIVQWEEGQLLHPWHKKSRLIGKLGGRRVGSKVVNPDGWGET